MDRPVIVLAGVAMLVAATVVGLDARSADAAGATGGTRFVGASNAGGTPKLVAFTSADPSTVQPLTLSGLGMGEVIAGLDVRPATGALYALARRCVGPVCSHQLYSVQVNLSASTATFSAQGSSFMVQGTLFGFDFNPTVDRIRIVSESNQNYRVHPDTGALTTDTSLAYSMGDTNFGKDPDAVGVAYIPAAFGGTTTLYDIDAKQDVLVTQTPANDGALQTVGRLGVDATGVIGFDISGRPGGRVFRAWAAIQPAGQMQSTLYRINLSSGNARSVGHIGGGAPIEALAALRPR